ncbi:MAG: acyltransferase [Clostridiales bacterium]|nr:acyltransferase [Clostridiales bacterium]
MAEKRNVLFDVTRMVAAVGIILGHVDMSGFGAAGELVGQFLWVRTALMFFLAIIGFYVEKAYQAGKEPIRKRVTSLVRVYGVWSLIYLALSFVMLVLKDGMPLGDYLLSRVKGFLFTGSYYHFWFYPAVIYSLLIIACVKKALGGKALKVLLPVAVVLYALGLLGTGYLPLGRQIPLLKDLYAWADFEGLMHLFLLGFPAVVFGMAAAHVPAKAAGRALPAAAAAFLAECIVLCFALSWREDPQMLFTTPVLIVCFLAWGQTVELRTNRVNPAMLRTVSAGMYNVHPLILAGFALVLPGLNGLIVFALCTVAAAVCGYGMYRGRKHPVIRLLM